MPTDAVPAPSEIAPLLPPDATAAGILSDVFAILAALEREAEADLGHMRDREYMLQRRYWDGTAEDRAAATTAVAAARGELQALRFATRHLAERMRVGSLVGANRFADARATAATGVVG